MADTCVKLLFNSPRRGTVCAKPAKATIHYYGNETHRVCGNHAREAARRLEDVTWDRPPSERW
jgi:hypothetical protein